MQLKVICLEEGAGISKKSNKAYNLPLIRIVEGGRVGKMFSDVSFVGMVDKEVLVDVKFTPNNDGFLSVSVASIVGKK